MFDVVVWRARWYPRGWRACTWCCRSFGLPFGAVQRRCRPFGANHSGVAVPL